jgi:hypothetical protein
MTKLMNTGHSSRDGEYEYKNVWKWCRKVPGTLILSDVESGGELPMLTHLRIACCLLTDLRWGHLRVRQTVLPRQCGPNPLGMRCGLYARAQVTIPRFNGTF